MRGILTLAVGLALLISAAAATGNYNVVDVVVTEEVLDNCVTGDAVLAQVTGAASYIAGNGNYVLQYEDLRIEENAVIGIDESGISEMAFQVANATGSFNLEEQYITLDTEYNCITDGNMDQFAMQTADLVGSYNWAWQETQADADYNALTMSDLLQMSAMEACATGTENFLGQYTYQGAFDNCLTLSDMWQQVAQEENIMGCANNWYYDPVLQCDVYAGQCAYEISAENALTGSMMNQLICQDQEIIGDANFVDQYADTEAVYNCFTLGGMVQGVEEIAASMGCGNEILQCVDLHSFGNAVTGGMVIQDTTIVSNA